MECHVTCTGLDTPPPDSSALRLITTPEASRNNLMSCV